MPYIGAATCGGSCVGRKRAAGRQRDTLDLTACRTSESAVPPIAVASQHRDWMTRTAAHFADRCLPLLMANQAGWFLLSTHAIRATWAGDTHVLSLRVELLDGTPPFPVISHFGHGLLTWRVPYLFRTPKGYDLLVRGPANWPKDGAYPLEGLVETDWAIATFTMNWKLTRPGFQVVFEKGEPFCMIVPQRRDEIVSFHPHLKPIGAAPKIGAAHRLWSNSRDEFLSVARPLATENPPWQRDYFLGRAPGGANSVEHRLKVRLRPFE